MNYYLTQSRFAHFFTADTKSAAFWLVVRLYVGYEWLAAGIDKVLNPAWFGPTAGAGIKGFVAGALTKTAGAHPDVQSWYVPFLQNIVQPYPTVWANAIALGEVLVGVGLIVGVLVGTAAFFGCLMNLNFMLSGTVSINPVLFTLGILLILSRRVAGYYGLGRYVRPIFYRIPLLRRLAT
jgi:thiosulfate dehydrogenase (quinone) large subunit